MSHSYKNMGSSKCRRPHVLCPAGKAKNLGQCPAVYPLHWDIGNYITEGLNDITPAC